MRVSLCCAENLVECFKVKVEEGTETFASFYLCMKEPPKDRDNFFYWEGSPPPRYNNVMTWWVEPKAGGSGTSLELLEVQLEGRKRTSADAFRNGQRLGDAEQLGERIL